MKLLVVAALFICGTQGLSVPSDCPGRDVALLERHSGGVQGANKMASGTPRFGINSPLFDVYEPGETYDFELGQADDSLDTVARYYLISTAVEEEPMDCPSLGSWQQLLPDYPEPMEGCGHVLELHGHQRTFSWTAPECGCVTISVVVVAEDKRFYADDVDRLQGPLTQTLCAHEDDDLDIATTLDDDFYGIDGDDDDNDILEEVTEIMTEEELEVDEDEEDYNSEEDGEEDRWGRQGRRFFRGKKGRFMRKKGVSVSFRRGPRGRGMRSEEREDFRGKWRSQEEEERTEGLSREEGVRGRRKLWKKKMGRKMNVGRRATAKKADKLERVCSRVEDRADAPMRTRGAKKSLLTEAAIEEKRERWASFRDDITACCNSWDDTDDEDEENEAVVECFKSAHSRRMVEKMCGAEADDFKTGELPEKIEAAQEKCCEIEGEEQRECIVDSIKVARKLKRAHKRHGHVSEEQRVDGLCKRVEKQPVPKGKQLSKLPVTLQNRWTTLFTERRLQMSECCKLDEAEQVACINDLREQRLDRVCQGEEDLSPPWKRKAEDNDEITDVCCLMEDVERYDCFNENMGHHHHQPHHKGHHHHHKSRSHRRGHHGRSHHHRRGEDSSEEVDEEVAELREAFDEEDRKDRRPVRMQSGKRGRAARKQKRKANRQCCQAGRTAGNALEIVTNKKWQTCNAEAEGYVVDRDENKEGCHKAFRKCCMKSVIRNTREMMVENAMDEEDDVDVEEI